jgi:hypothetical protein
MADEPTNITTASFTGQWIGETQGIEMAAHIWEIHQQGNLLVLTTRWEGETEAETFYARLVPGEPAFQIMVPDENKATLLDKQHFVILGWCWDGRYDVIFSRPGLAELTARAVYLNSLNKKYLGSDTP